MNALQAYNRLVCLTGLTCAKIGLNFRISANHRPFLSDCPVSQ